MYVEKEGREQLCFFLLRVLAATRQLTCLPPSPPPSLPPSLHHRCRHRDDASGFLIAGLKKENEERRGEKEKKTPKIDI